MDSKMLPLGDTGGSMKPHCLVDSSGGYRGQCALYTLSLSIPKLQRV
jgi:hypothetical protein